MRINEIGIRKEAVTLALVLEIEVHNLGLQMQVHPCRR